MSSKRLATNTLVTYGRSLLSMGLSLFSSRWVLNALGQSDFGLYSVVGALIVFIVFINGTMAGGAARFFAYSIGQGQPEEVKQWFNASLSLHLMLSCVLIAIGWPVGEWIVRHKLVIPSERLTACVWIFRASLVSAFVCMISVPFSALFMAYQRLTELALWGLVQSTLIFFLAYGLCFHFGNTMLLYASGMVAITVLIQSIQVGRALWSVPTCSIELKYWFSRNRLKQMTSFSGWTLIGSSGAVLRDQGSAMLLNTHFGPTVNSAYGIAMQVSAQTNQLAAALLGSFTPEITASEGRGERDRMLRLANQASKFGTILVMIFAIPLMIEMEQILIIWLKTPPIHAATFCRYILATFIIDRLTTGFMLAVSAKGQINGYQATVGGTLLLVLPVAWLFLNQGMAPTSVGLAFFLVMACTSLGRALWMKRLFDQPVRQWLRNVVLCCVINASLSAAAGLVVKFLMASSILRILGVSIATTTVFAATAPWVLTSQEKDMVYRIKERIVARFSRRVT